MRSFSLNFFIFLFCSIFFSFNLSADGLTGTYYNNNSFTAPSTLIRTDATINFEWDSGSPSGTINNDNYSVKWTGYIYIPENANYTFSLAHDDIMVLKINNEELYNNNLWTGGSNNYRDITSKYYSAGYYPITIEFTEWTGGAYAKFAWRNDVSIGTRTIVPTTNLFTSVVGNYIKSEYRFDECFYEGSANEVLDSVGSSNAQSFNGVEIDKTDSILCSSASFDGVDDYISMGDTFNNIFGSTNDKFTITGWIKPTSFNPSVSNHGTANTIFAKASDNKNDNLEIGVNSDGSLHVYIDATTDFKGNIGSGITLNNWHFISVSYDGSKLEVIIDGNKYTNNTPSGNFANATGSPFTVGTTLHSDTSFTGLIDEVKIFDSALSETEINSIYTNEINSKTYNGDTRVCNICENSYCKSNSLSKGFHIIDPDGGSDKNSFEIFCYQDSSSTWHDLIALPIKNNSNNFLFDNDSTDNNYYDESKNPREHFQAIEINANNITYSGTLDDGETPRPLIPVVISSDMQPYDIETEGKSYKVMGSGFSNINLIGTPFIIDWDETDELTNCNESTLRKALGQAVKYNTLIGDNKSRCEIKKMTLSLLDDYQFLSYQGSEVLQHSCKDMALYVPNNIGILTDEDIRGHFNILTSEPKYAANEVPTTNGVRDNGKDIGAEFRPVTVYCDYQEDLKYVWTFLTALDGKVTRYKTDLVQKKDTCSQLGLYFYVPNSKDTFNRVRQYLKSQKTGNNGWENYTGTIEEKIKALTSSNVYYLSEFKDVLIWPYGPFGVYLSSGTKSAPRAPMHNIPDLANYNDSMGKKGWVSILKDLGRTEDWWISDIGAGLEITKIADGSANDNSTYSPHGNHPKRTHTYDEPNGNYTYNAWYNFLYDDEGWVYHNDDWDANYPYYDYMCMSETNYDIASRYSLVSGFFDAIERIRNTGGNFSDQNLTTQIVSKDIKFDIISYSVDSNTGLINKSILDSDQNKSVGVFLSTIEENESPVPKKFLGTFKNFAGNNGRIEINDFNISSANKRASIKFYFCNDITKDWTECWNYNNNANSPTVMHINDGNTTDSSDDFAIRPEKFYFEVDGGNVVKAKDVVVKYYAYDNLNQATNGYNEYFSNLDIATSLADTSLTCPNTSLFLIPPTQFTDGVETNTTKLKNVGKFNIKIQEISGLEFAAVDLDDNVASQDNSIEITPYDDNLTIVPDHFSITPITQVNYSSSNFTYLSNDLDNMAIRFDTNVTAKNDLNETTPNYTDGCYAKDINTKIKYTLFKGAAPTTIHYEEINTNVNGNSAFNTNEFSLSNIDKSRFSTAHNGTAELSVRANFGRANNIAANPFVVNFNDINISDTSTSVTVYNEYDHVIDKDANMLYGRSHAPRQRFSANANQRAFIYYEAYCDGAGDRTLLPNGTTSNTTDDPRWFINTSHTVDSGTAGTVTQKTTGTVRVTQNIAPTGNHQDSVTITYDGTRGKPYKATMENNASSWLIYNKYNPADTTNKFEVEFEGGTVNWVGKHETNTTSVTDGTDRTNRRSMW